MDRVLDAFALLAWLQDERGAELVESMLKRAAAGEQTLHISSINAGEVYYRLIKVGKRKEAQQFLSDLRIGEIPLRRVTATNGRVDAAAALKAAHPISFADAFAVALAQELRAPLVTNDPEITALYEQGIVQVVWVDS